MRNESGSTGIGFIIAVIVIFLIMGACGAMTPESKAVNAAKNAQYTDVTVVDKAIYFVGFRGCDEKDNARFTVQGTSVRGEPHEFYVCASVVKGGTVRSK